MADRYNNGQQIIQNQQLKLTLSGSHHLDETALILELQRYNIGLNKTSNSNVFILDIPKTLTNATFNISTIDESKESDNTIQIAGIIDGTSVISKIFSIIIKKFQFHSNIVTLLLIDR